MTTTENARRHNTNQAHCIVQSSHSTMMSSVEELGLEEEEEMEMRFSCVECWTPSWTVYRQLSETSHHSVKLTKCRNGNCNRDVDPYIEREWLLVAMDGLLLRKPAYRHVLLNYYTHERLLCLPPNTHNVPNNQHSKQAPSSLEQHDTTATTSLIRAGAVQYGLAACLLDAYLRYEAMMRTPTTTTALSFDRPASSSSPIM